MRRQYAVLIVYFLCQISAAEDLLITMNSYGSVALGMTVEEAYKKLGLSFPAGFMESDPDAEVCNYYHPTKDLSFKTEGRIPKIVRIETTNPEAVTPSGIRVGDPISKVKQLLGDRLSDKQQHYSDDPKYRTLVIVSKNGKLAMRFEVNGGFVAEIYSGYERHIHYVEGCS
jgi:hypothetical protein